MLDISLKGYLSNIFTFYWLSYLFI